MPIKEMFHFSILGKYWTAVNRMKRNIMYCRGKVHIFFSPLDKKYHLFMQLIVIQNFQICTFQKMAKFWLCEWRQAINSLISGEAWVSHFCNLLQIINNAFWDDNNTILEARWNFGFYCNEWQQNDHFNFQVSHTRKMFSDWFAAIIQIFSTDALRSTEPKSTIIEEIIIIAWVSPFSSESLISIFELQGPLLNSSLPHSDRSVRAAQLFKKNVNDGSVQRNLSLLYLILTREIFNMPPLFLTDF